jgi:DNA polymerase-3 subunit gamma/tau
VKGLDRLAQCDSQYKATKEPRLLVELTLIQLCRINATSTNGKAVEQAPIAEKKSPDLGRTPATGVPPGSIGTPGAVPGPRPDARAAVPEDKVTGVNVVTDPAGPAVYVPKRRLAGQVSIKGAKAAVVEANLPTTLETDSGTGMPASSKVANAALLLKVWRDYALAQKNRGRDSLHATLMAKEPEVSGPGLISFTIVNTVQENYMREEKPELLGHLRRQLGDPGLELEVRKEEVVVKPRYTTLDKFKLMAEKNPALLTLRDAVDLDLG